MPLTSVLKALTKGKPALYIKAFQSCENSLVCVLLTTNESDLQFFCQKLATRPQTLIQTKYNVGIVTLRPPIICCTLKDWTESCFQSTLLFPSRDQPKAHEGMTCFRMRHLIPLLSSQSIFPFLCWKNCVKRSLNVALKIKSHCHCAVAAFISQ